MRIKTRGRREEDDGGEEGGLGYVCGIFIDTVTMVDFIYTTNFVRG
jgi:hypothetical protein